MGVLSLLNFVLVAIPIGATFGTVMGIQSHRSATGQEPLFKPEKPTTPGGQPEDQPDLDDDGIKIKYYCDSSKGFSPLSQGDHYTFNPNPWGWKEGEDGQICMNVTTWNNQTYPQDASSPEWSVTWQYPPGPQTAPVHAFPNVKLESGVFPEVIKSLEAIELDFEWTYAVGNSTAPTETDEKKLTASNLNANVALDMFIDSDKDKSKITEEAGTEVMVWFGAFGPATQPIGLAKGKEDEQEIDGTTFALYTGENSNGQTVLTWYAEKTAVKFHGDLAPLLNRLVKMGNTGFPKEGDYVGYLSLGTETYNADDFVTFHVPELAIDVKTK